MKTTEASTRRDFIKTTAAAAAGLTLAGCETSRDPEPGKPQIAIQLWTVRDQIEKDLSGTLGRLAEIGYQWVETAFFPESVSLAAGAKALKDAGLKVCAVHAEMPHGEERKRMLDMAEAYECETVVWHGWPEDPRYNTLDGILALASEFNTANTFAIDNGLRFGLHNHWWEFNAREGMVPFYELETHLDPDIFFEIDAYWAKVARMDPVEVITRLGDRVRLLHLKDGDASNTEGPMTVLGQGVQDVPGILAAATSLEWGIIELDAFEGDMMEAVGGSYEYLSGVI